MEAVHSLSDFIRPSHFVFGTFALSTMNKSVVQHWLRGSLTGESSIKSPESDRNIQKAFSFLIFLHVFLRLGWLRTQGGKDSNSPAGCEPEGVSV